MSEKSVKKPGQKWYAIVQNMLGGVKILEGKNRAALEKSVNELVDTESLCAVIRGTQYKAISQARFSFVDASPAAEIIGA